MAGKKKAVEETPNTEGLSLRQQKIAALAADINKMFKGKGAVLAGSEFSNVFILRRPTGIISLDIALGGGFPAGGLTEIIGKEGVGKDYLVNKAIANCQEIYGEDATIGLCQTEMPWDKAYAKWKCGVKVALSPQEISYFEQAQGRPYTPEELTWLTEQVGTIHQAIFSTAEQLLEVAVNMVESNLYHIVVVNSFGALLTEAEASAEEGLEQKFRGGASTVITSFMHRLHAALNLPDKEGKPNTTTVIGINQYRANVTAGLYGNPMTIAGGHALKHGKLVSLHVEAGKRHKIKVGNEDVIIGKEINWETIKGKAGCHDGVKGSYNFYFGEHGYPFGVDEIEDLLLSAFSAGIITMGGGGWSNYNGERFQGKDALVKYLKDNPHLISEIRKSVLEKNNINCIYKIQ